MAQNKRMFANREALLKGIEAFAVADTRHYDDTKNIIAGCVLHASDHGDLDPLSILYRKVSLATQGVVKRAIKRINTAFGENHQFGGQPFGLIDFRQKYEHILEGGKQGPNHKLPTFFFTQKVEVRGKEYDVDVKEIRNEIRRAISAVDEPTLARFIDSAEQAATNSFVVLPNIADDLAKVIKRHAQLHSAPKGLLVEINKLIKGTEKDKALDVEDLYAKGQNPNDWTEKKERELAAMLAAKERAEKAMKQQLEVQKAEGHKAEKPKEQAAA